MAQPYRCTVMIDGMSFGAVSCSVTFGTQKDRTGMPQMGSLSTTIRIVVDFHDDRNMPHEILSRLFELANVVTGEKVKDVKIEFWRDDSHNDALCSYRLKGWISRFETSTPLNDAGARGPASEISHLLILDIEPALNQGTFREVTMGN